MVILVKKIKWEKNRKRKKMKFFTFPKKNILSYAKKEKSTNYPTRGKNATKQ